MGPYERGAFGPSCLVGLWRGLVRIRCARARREWPLLRNKLLTLDLRDNLVTDAWTASTVETLGEHLVTFDYDFGRLLPARDFTLLPSTN